MKIDRNNTTLRIAPESDLIASQVEALRDDVLASLKQEAELDQIVLDATGIDVIDSLGVNLIIGIFRESESRSISFEVINASEKFKRVSDFFQFENFFNVSPE